MLWLADSLAENAGTERQVVELSRYLCSPLDLHVATFRTAEPRLPEQVTFAGFPLESLWSPQGMFQIARLAKFIQSRDIQLVHGFMLKSSLAGALAGAIAGTPLILVSRRNLGYHYTGRSLRVTRLVNRVVTRVVANSQAAKDIVVKTEGVHPEKVDVLYNGVDTDKFYPRRPDSEEPDLPVPAGAPVVGIVANYRPVKDLGLFLRASAIVAQEVPQAYFLMVGSGTMEKHLRRLAAQFGIGDRVIFTCGQGDVLPYLHRMSVACLSSLSEGFSNSILEYMAAGLPTVVTDVGGNGEAVQDGWTGFVVKDRSPEAFAAPIVRLLQDSALRTAMGRNGLTRCHNEFAINEASHRLGEYYQWLFDKPAVKEAVAGMKQVRTW